jgi:hypothetical protein
MRTPVDPNDPLLSTPPPGYVVHTLPEGQAGMLEIRYKRQTRYHLSALGVA